MTNSVCAHARAHFSCHLDGQPLPFFTRFMVGFHLSICPPCRRVNRSLQATQAALRALRDADVDPGEALPDAPPR